ncbi:MAG: hypothetical protein JWR84_129 [Caulobacter sp.]|nr:hypothetical protein [Caulobacter sp.]
MSSELPSAERIERLQKRRTRLAFVQGFFFLIWQTSYFTQQPEDFDLVRPVNQIKIGAYVVWAGMLLLFLATGGGWALSRQTRAILNDESTIEHRRRAFTVGFWVAMASCLALYVVGLFTPITSGQTLHTILSLAIAASLLTFARLERRAQKDG